MKILLTFYSIIRKDMDVNDKERLSNFTLRHICKGTGLLLLLVHQGRPVSCSDICIVVVDICLISYS
jgi:hypothetical protein